MTLLWYIAAILIWWLVKSLQNSESNALRKRTA
jgi:hypothetical protein